MVWCRTISLCVVSFIVLVASTSVTFYPGEYELGVEQRKSIFLEAYFDAGLKIDPSASSWDCKSVHGPSTVQSCCPPGITVNCYSPVSPYGCVDSSSSFPVAVSYNPSTGLGTGFTQFSFRLLDYATCGSAYISVVPSMGVVYLDAFSDGTNPYYFTKNPTTGSVVICCENFPPGSNGIVYVNVMGLFNSKSASNVIPSINIRIFTDPNNLTVSNFLDLVETRSTFLGTTEVPCNATTPYCVPNVFATADTPFDFNYRLLNSNPLVFVPNKMSLEIIIFRHNLIYDTITQLINWDALGSSFDAVVAFTNVATSVSSVNRLQLNCTGAENNVKVNEVQAAILALSQLDSLVPDYIAPGRFEYMLYPQTVNWQLRQLSAPQMSKSWLACKNFIENKLSIPSLVNNETISQPGKCTKSIGTPGWDSDPCCNFELLSKYCCAPTYSVVNRYIPSVPPTSERIEPYCTSSTITCAMSELQNYDSALARVESCSSNEILQPNTTASIFQRCRDYLFPTPCATDADCRAKFPIAGAYCKLIPGLSVTQYAARTGLRTLNKPTGFRTCRPLCRSNSDCVYGTCVNKGGWSECVMDTTTDPYVQTNFSLTLATCFANAVASVSIREPRFKTRVLNVLGISGTSTTDIINAVIAATASSTCPLKVLSAGTTGCSQQNSCSSFICEPNAFVSDCTLNCDTSQFFCAKNLPLRPFVKQQVNQNNTCLSFALDTSGQCSIMTLGSGAVVFNGLTANENCVVRGQVPTQATCIPDEFCSEKIPVSMFSLRSYRDLAPPIINNGSVCLPVCVNTSITSASQCTGSKQLWNPISLRCEVAALGATECTGVSHVWWPGSVWLPSGQKYETMSTCGPSCVLGSSFTTKDSCLANFYCTNPQCTGSGCGQSACTNSGYCNYEPGCYFPLTQVPYGECPISMINSNFIQNVNSYLRSVFILDLTNLIEWTPIGCRFPLEFGLPINKVTCQARGGVYYSYTDWRYNMNESACLALGAQLCYVGTQSTTPSKLSSVWPGYTVDPNSSCTSCGGKVVSPYQWIKGEYIAASPDFYLDLSWQGRTLTTLYTNNVASTITQDDFDRVLGLADQLREADFVKNRLNCLADLYGSVSTITCLCPGTNSTQAAGECSCSDSSGPGICAAKSIQSSTPSSDIGCIGGFQITQEWPITLTSTLKVFTWSTESFFLKRTKIPIDSGRIFTTQIRRDEQGFIKNKNNIIVGQIVGDGFSVSFTQIPPSTDPVPGFLARVDFALATGTREPSLAFVTLDIGRVRIVNTSNGTQQLQFPIELLNLQLPIATNNYSMNISQGYVYFPVELVSNYDALTYVDTLQQSMIPVFYGCLAIYAVGILLLALLAVVDLLRNGKQLKTYVKPAFILMGFAFALRIAWIVYIMNDPQSDRITILFIELPAMLYFALASWNLNRWYGNRLRPGNSEYYTMENREQQQEGAIRKHRKGYDDDDDGCTQGCCLPKLKMYVHVVLTVTLLAFIVAIVFVMVNIGSDYSSGGSVSGEAQIAEFAWFSFFVTFLFIEIVWFLLLILCGVCTEALEVFEPSEEGDNTRRGMTLAAFLSMIGVVLVTVAQTILIVRVFLWRPFAGMEWDAATAVGYTVLLDMVPALVVIICCILSPYQHGTVFRRKY